MEGAEHNCNDAWSIIKSWNWKKINVRHQEEEKVDENSDHQTIEIFRRFKGFQEIGFVKNGETRDYHMDMSEFSKYLDQNDCLYMFKILFGFEKQVV